MTIAGRVKHRHYTITIHALSRYLERTGSDLSRMMLDIDNAWVFYLSRRNIEARRYRYIALKAYRAGAYLLTNGYLIFVVKPYESHHILTVFAK